MSIKTHDKWDVYGRKLRFMLALLAYYIDFTTAELEKLETVVGRICEKPSSKIHCKQAMLYTLYKYGNIINWALRPQLDEIMKDVPNMSKPEAYKTYKRYNDCFEDYIHVTLSKYDKRYR